MPEQSKFEEQLIRESLSLEIKETAIVMLHSREIAALTNTICNHARNPETMSLRQFLRHAIKFAHFIDTSIFGLPGGAAGYDAIYQEQANLHILIAVLMLSGIQPESNDPRNVEGLGLAF